MKYKLIIIIWIIIIFALSSVSGNQLHKVPKLNIPYLDKLIHFAIYFILQYIFLLIYTKIPKYQNIKHFILITASFSISYGVIMEFSQEYVFINRSSDFSDGLANTLGVLTIIFLYKIKFVQKLKFLP